MLTSIAGSIAEQNEIWRENFKKQNAWKNWLELGLRLGLWLRLGLGLRLTLALGLVLVEEFFIFCEWYDIFVD